MRHAPERPARQDPLAGLEDRQDVRSRGSRHDATRVEVRELPDPHAVPAPESPRLAEVSRKVIAGQSPACPISQEPCSEVVPSWFWEVCSLSLR